MFEYARRSGERIVQMVWEDLKPRDDSHGGRVPQCRRRGARRQRLDQLHQASAGDGRRSGVDVDVFALFNELGKKVPVLSAVRPNGDDSDRGVRRCRRRPRGHEAARALLDLDVLTVTGETLARESRRRRRPRRGGHPPARRPFSDKPPIVVLRGSLAPDSAIVKLGLRDPSRKDKFVGPAIVYDDGFEAIGAIMPAR